MRLRLAFLLTSVLLAQTATAADPIEHLRYERAIQLPPLPPQGLTPVCAVLDAAAFAHAASRSGNDLRLYSEPATAEIPFTLRESEAAPEDAAPATVQNLTAQGDTISFDLAMPPQAYTAVELHLAAKDFIAEATVTSGLAALGTFTLFDLTQEHLTRSTELALQETRLARLHVALRLWHLDGSPVTHPSPAIVQGADTPPSRQAQTLYTTVASTGDLRSSGGALVATLPVAAHVPVERLRLVLDPRYQENLLRPIRIDATAETDHGRAIESVQGNIARVDRSLPNSSAPAVHYESLALDATLGANLRRPALVHVEIPNEPSPLHLRSVELQMRQRSLCFDAAAGTHYTLRYGDAGLPAPVYDDGIGDVAAGARVASYPRRPLPAVLGPEIENPAFVARPRTTSRGETHPEMFWVGLLSMVVLSAALSVHRARHEKRRS
jgi:hypothetical protein